DLGADEGGCARAVIDDDGLAHLVGELLPDQPPHEIGSAAGGERHDQPDGPVRIVLGETLRRLPGECRGAHRERDTKCARGLHDQAAALPRTSAWIARTVFSMSSSVLKKDIDRRRSPSLTLTTTRCFSRSRSMSAAASGTSTLTICARSSHGSGVCESKPACLSRLRQKVVSSRTRASICSSPIDSRNCAPARSTRTPRKLG